MISLKPVIPESLSAAIGAALLLAACAAEPPPQATVQALSPPKASAPVVATVPLAGLTPLPSSSQVVASVAAGRVDPFASLATPPSRAQGILRPTVGTGRPASLSLPSGLVFNGVIRACGRPEALVQFAGESGTLRVGQRGGSNIDPRATPLLPAGWSVASIDVQNGRLTLRQGKQAVTAELWDKP